MKKIETKQLVTCALLACASGLLSGPLSFYFGTWKMSFGSIPVMVAGILCGPLLGGMTGFVADLVNFALAPRGGYNPLFSLTFALYGVISALVYRSNNKPTIKNLVVTTASTQLLCSFFLNTLIMVVFYGATPALFITKLTYNLIKIPINAIVLQIVLTQLIFKAKSH